MSDYYTTGIQERLMRQEGILFLVTPKAYGDVVST